MIHRSEEPRNRGPGVSLGEATALGFGVGVLTGLLYAVVMLIRQRGLGQFAWVSRDVVWMAPLAHAVMFTAAAVAFWLVTRRLRAGRRITAAGLVFLAVFSLLLPFGQIARWAAALLALGIAFQTSRLYVRRLPGARPVGRIGLALALLVTALGLGQRGWLVWQRHRSAARLPQAPAGAPNVLLIIWDTVRDADVSLSGYSRPTTPALARWARSGASFARVFATAPWTLPSHASIFTGEYAGQTGTDWRIPLSPSARTLAEAFRDHGYLTGGFVANLLYTSYESGLDQGFLEYRDYRLTPRLVLAHTPIAQTILVQQLLRARSRHDLWRAVRRFDLSPGQLPADQPIPAARVTDRFLAWEKADTGRPFFAFLNYFDAHGPYRAPDSVRARLGLSDAPRDRYDAAIAYLDGELDRLLRELARRGGLDHTIVVVTSDHGEQFGEHDLKGHANSLYSPLLHVPLVIRFPPAVPEGVRVTTPVSLRDLPSTILTLAGLPAEPAFPGHSLGGAWSDSTWTPSPIVSELTRGINVDSTFPNARTGLASIIEGPHHYIRNGLGAEWLFDLTSDSTEARNLANTEIGPAIIQRLRTRLDGIVGRP